MFDVPVALRSLLSLSFILFYGYLLYKVGGEGGGYYWYSYFHTSKFKLFGIYFKAIV